MNEEEIILRGGDPNKLVVSGSDKFEANKPVDCGLAGFTEPKAPNSLFLWVEQNKPVDCKFNEFETESATSSNLLPSRF